MQYSIWFDRTQNIWHGYIIDSDGEQLGEPVVGHSEADAAFILGLTYGQHPQRFTRDIGDYFKAAEASPDAL